MTLAAGMHVWAGYSMMPHCRDALFMLGEEDTGHATLGFHTSVTTFRSRGAHQIVHLLTANTL